MGNKLLMTEFDRRELNQDVKSQLLTNYLSTELVRVQELCESQGGRPGLLVLMSLMVSVDVKQH